MHTDSKSRKRNGQRPSEELVVFGRQRNGDRGLCRKGGGDVAMSERPE